MPAQAHTTHTQMRAPRTCVHYNAVCTHGTHVHTTHTHTMHACACATPAQYTRHTCTCHTRANAPCLHRHTPHACVHTPHIRTLHTHRYAHHTHVTSQCSLCMQHTCTHRTGVHTTRTPHTCAHTPHSQSLSPALSHAQLHAFWILSTLSSARLLWGGREVTAIQVDSGFSRDLGRGTGAGARALGRGGSPGPWASSPGGVVFKDRLQCEGFRKAGRTVAWHGSEEPAGAHHPRPQRRR